MGETPVLLLLVDILGRYPGHPPGTLQMSHNKKNCFEDFVSSRVPSI